MTTGKPTRCRHQGAPLTLTEEGFDVRLDPEPLGPLGELRCVLAGRRTYTVHTGTGAVFHRPARTIRSRPAGTIPRQHVHAEHQCTPSPPGES